MNGIDIILDGDNAWPDLKGKIGTDEIIHLGNDHSIAIAALPGGMTSGSTSLMIRVDLPDGKTLLVETSLRLFLAAASAFRARFGSGGE